MDGENEQRKRGRVGFHSPAFQSNGSFNGCNFFVLRKLLAYNEIQYFLLIRPLNNDDAFDVMQENARQQDERTSSYRISQSVFLR